MIDGVNLERNPRPEQEAEELFESHDDREKRLRNKSLRQNIKERRKYANRSFILTCFWVGFIMLSTAAQFVLNAFHWGLPSAQFVVLITSTTFSVLGYWLIVGRYLFQIR